MRKLKKIIYVQKYNNSSIVHYDNGERKYVNLPPYKLIRNINNVYCNNLIKNVYKAPILFKDSLLQPTMTINNKNCEFIDILSLIYIKMENKNIHLYYRFIDIKIKMNIKTFYKIQRQKYLIFIRLKWWKY